MYSFRLIAFVFISFIVTGCAGLPQNIQHGNLTGKIDNNRWDYFNDAPIPYTSNQRSLSNAVSLLVNENTDRFQINLNAPKNKNSATLVMNSKIITVEKISGKETLDALFSQVRPQFNNRRELLDVFDVWYASADKKYFLAVRHELQIALTFFIDGETVQGINYLPSRYLACKKIVRIKNEKDKAVAVALLKTALVAGIQSYTSYATGTYSSSYGDFGYVSVRDYSWAGERAGEALGTLFSGQYSDEKITQAWNSLNCW